MGGLEDRRETKFLLQETLDKLTGSRNWVGQLVKDVNREHVERLIMIRCKVEV